MTHNLYDSGNTSVPAFPYHCGASSLMYRQPDGIVDFDKASCIGCKACIAAWLESNLVPALAWMISGTSLLHLVFVLGEVTLAHPTAHTRLAVEEMTRGSFARYFWSGVALTALGLGPPWVGVLAVPGMFLGLLAHEHAYVQAGQVMPLA